jgi:hypothetical protein
MERSKKAGRTNPPPSAICRVIVARAGSLIYVRRHTSPNFVPFPTTTYPENPVGPDELDPGMDSEKSENVGS